MEIINKYLTGCLVPIALAACSLFFLFLFKFKPFIRPKVIIRSLFKKKSNNSVSPLRALIFALAGTLGVGNIVGVSSAIILGGAGAVFWMWISALLAMILKYSEVVLAIRHRRIRNGEYYGGAMYYMRDYFYGHSKIAQGVIFCFVFVILCLINGTTMGCMIQSNAISTSFGYTFGVSPKMIGIIIAVMCVVVFLFNGNKVFYLCERLVPLVSGLYILMSLATIIINWEKMPSVFDSIFTSAFDFGALGAGAFGFLLSRALRYGTIRGLFSNEAGCGTSPIAHATANTGSPCEEGFLGMVEVFIDTIVVCTLTALVILSSGKLIPENAEPMQIVIDAFESTLGKSSTVLLATCIFMFAFATIICWGYYGKECVYFFNKSKKCEVIYYISYISLSFFGSYTIQDTVWSLADFAIGAMTLMNLYILVAMRNEIKIETDSYYNEYNKRASRGKLK